MLQNARQDRSGLASLPRLCMSGAVAARQDAAIPPNQTEFRFLSVLFAVVPLAGIYSELIDFRAPERCVRFRN